MADYKLKLEIDAAVLQKQLETAFKKGFKFAGGGAGGAGGSSGAFEYSKKHSKNMQKLDNQNYKLTLKQKKDLEKHTYTLKTEYAKQKTLLRAQNIMLEKSGVQQQRTFRMIGQLLGGRMGGAGGAGMDQVITLLSSQRKRRGQVKASQQAYDDMAALPGAKMGPRPEQEPNAFNAMADIGSRLKDSPIGEFLGSTKKTFDEKVPGAKKTGDIAGKIGSKVPQAVKLAGVGAALAGGAGLAKMIVDSSPILKQMLKLLNVGIMLVLRPIGDFIGFMLRPLLLEFVKKVAVPAYKSGSKLAREWGDKAGKVLLLLFTDLPTFFERAIVNPIKGSLDKGWAQMVTSFKNLGVMLNPFIMDKDSEIAKNNAELDAQFAEIDKKYPGLGDMGQIQTLLDARDDKDLIGPVIPTLDATATNTKNINEKLATLPEDSAQAYANAQKQLEDAKIKASLDQQKESNQRMDEIMKEASKGIGITVGQEVLGSAEIERRAKEKENQTTQKSWEKRVDGFAKGNYEGLSDAAKKILAGADNYKAGAIGSGTAAQAGGAYGIYNPMQTSDMGGKYGTGEFEKYAVDGNTCIASREIYGNQNFAAETREEMEAYTEAIKAANEHGTLVTDEYKLIVDKAQEAYEQQVLTTDNAKNVRISSDVVQSEFETMESNVETMTVATKSMADNLNEQALYVASLLRKAANIKKDNGGTRYKWADPMAGGLENNFGGSYNNQSVPNVVRSRYKVTFGDGSTHEQVMDPQSYAHIMKMYGTGQPYRGKTMISVQKMAAGGLITEPVFGIGQRSGKGYLMGEAGPERVTPGTGQPNGTSGGNTFNITINASGIGDIERQLKPAILKMLKESTSRAGIV